MKAVVATRYGGPDVVEIVERPIPEPGPNDVRIAVRAASLNPLDFKIREGKVKLVLPLKPPVALGCDVAGVVDAVGSEVTKLKVGDEVFARLEKMRMGGLAEYVCAHAGVVAIKPKTASFEQAAAVPLAGLTALQALREHAQAKPGQRVMITAGAGGVGSLAIQIAKVLGLHVLTTTSTKNIDFVRSLGADEIIDYTKTPATDWPNDIDVAFDSLGGASEIQSIRNIREGGTVVAIGGLPDAAFAKERLPWFARGPLWLMTMGRRRQAQRANVRFIYVFMRPDGAELAELASWIDAGKVKPIIHQAFPLVEVKEAFAELERGRARGKIVVTI